MNLLAIESSSDYASVALTIKGEILSRKEKGFKSHARLLLPMIEGLLADAALSLSQLHGIVYGQGPGSFTGLRIACSVAKGLAYGHDLPLFPVSSLRAIAEDVFSHYSSDSLISVLTLIDARMNELYWAFFPHREAEPTEYLAKAAAIDVACDSPLVLAGVGFSNYLQYVSPKITKHCLNQLEIFPQAEAMLRIALRGKLSAVSAAEATPVYIRNQVTQGESRG